VAVIDRNIKKTDAALTALTAAALVLPGLLSPSAHAAEGDEVDFQYGHYQEGLRTIDRYNLDKQVSQKRKSSNPIEVDSLHGHGNFTLTDRVKFAFNYTQDTWGGATPISSGPGIAQFNQIVSKTSQSGHTTIVGASPNILPGGGTLTRMRVDNNNNFYRVNPTTLLPLNKTDNRITHVMSTASPETRKQGDFKLSYEWDEAALSVGGGISTENDYESRFGNIGGLWFLNNKLTTLNLDLSYTNSDTHAILNHDAYTYIGKDQYFLNHVANAIAPPGVSDPTRIINGNRQDWGTHFGVSQVLNKDALVGADFSYTRSTGYMANPYKVTEVIFVDPSQFQFSKFATPQINNFLERRPDVRDQWAVGGRYVQYINALDAALHFDYRFSADNWGIQAHSFEADWVQPIGDGWSVTPRVRYYSQDAADFYTPFLLIKEKQTKELITIGDRKLLVPSNKLPTNFSSDQRLSGYGTLSGGVTVSKRFAKGLSVETGFEYYTHQGGLKIGGGGEGAFANFDYWVANAALKIDLNALSLHGGGGMDHADHVHHHGANAPAGVMFSHMLPKTGDFMVGYRYMYSGEGGGMLHGDNPVSDQQINRKGCAGDPCYLAPDSMAMHMHMLDLMYAPTDWLTLMLMPQLMDMNMSMRALEGVDSPNNSGAINIGQIGNGIDGHYAHHLQNGHQTGGIGDLGMYGLFKLFDNDTHHVHLAGGFTAPTGDVNIHLQRNHGLDGGFIHYGMQLGSGTWDFKPSLTYTGQIDRFSWGAQLNGTLRMEKRNESGYRLGDLFQATAWGGYNLTNWLSASIRGVYTWQGRIHGNFFGSAGHQFVKGDGTTPSSILKFGPMDYPGNYGGKYWDVGFGLTAVVPSGDLAGNRVSVEWLQPVHTDVNGYQLDRDGALSATWSVAF